VKTLSLYAMNAEAVPSPVPIAVMTEEMIASVRMASGMRVIAASGRIRLAVWIRSTAESPQKTATDRSDIVWLSKRACDLLHLQSFPTAVVLEVEEPDTMNVLPAFVDDLPRAAVVDVNGSARRRFGKWAIAYGPSIALPVLVRRRRVAAGSVRMTMLTRTLAGVNDAAAPQLRLAPLQRERLAWRDDQRGRTAIGGPFGVAISAVYRGMRHVVSLFELLLRPLVHAPELPMRTAEAKLGDDTNRVVRIAREAFSVLGIRPGDEVFVQWANRRVIAVAHEEFETTPESTARAATVDTWGHDAQISTLARHLVIGIAAEMRAELRIPRRTVVTVRRRVITLFVQRLNELTVPVGGLLLAALTIQGLSRALVAVGIVVVTILAMLPARYRVPPRGRWP
jgi:hypothetical protein